MSSFPCGRRFANETVSYDDELVSYRWKARGRFRMAAEYANDPDNGDFRADKTRGWKAHKHRYQWEHKVVFAEKRAKNAGKKGSRRGRNASPGEDA